MTVMGIPRARDRPAALPVLDCDQPHRHLGPAGGQRVPALDRHPVAPKSWA